MPAAAATVTLDRTIRALADPARRRVIELLRSEPRRAGDIAAGLGMSAPATSRHLRVLHKNGVVEPVGVDEDARVRLFRLRPEPLTELREWLSEVDAFWTMQLRAFKAHAERSRPGAASTRRRRRRP